MLRINSETITTEDGKFVLLSKSAMLLGTKHKIAHFSLTNDITVFVVHLLDKSRSGNFSQISDAIEVANLIRRTYEEYCLKEEKSEHSCVIVGDFNMNPWEPGVLMRSGFNASYFLPGTEEMNDRSHSGYEYLRFWNPVAGLAGRLNRENSRIKGTYRYHKLNPETFTNYQKYNAYEFHWNILDYVLLTPDLYNDFDLQAYQIICDKNPLNLSPGFSDHFPIYFELKT